MNQQGLGQTTCIVGLAGGDGHKADLNHHCKSSVFQKSPALNMGRERDKLI
jgi:hypothetical protein